MASAMLASVGMASASGRSGAPPDIYGWDIYSKNETPYGLYRMEGDAFNMVWADTFFDEYGTKVNNGFLKDGKIIGLATKELITYLLDYHYVVYDFETGKVLESKKLTIKEARITRVSPIILMTATPTASEGTISTGRRNRFSCGARPMISPPRR